MKRLLLLLGLALLLGAATYYLCRRPFVDHAAGCGMAMDQRVEMKWLRAEFHLDAAQYARVVTLHEKYQPVCDNLCIQIAAKNEEISKLIRANRVVTPELSQALNEAAALKVSCQSNMLEHIYAVSREMATGDGQRYVEMMLPVITDTRTVTPPPSGSAHCEKSHHP
jgi:hypothetical protein